MAEAFAIFGVISGSLGILNLILTSAPKLNQAAKDYKSAPRKVTRLINNLNTFNNSLDNFLSRWQITSTSSDRYIQALWGADGAHFVVQQAVDIHDQCADLERILGGLIDLESHNQRSQDYRIPQILAQNDLQPMTNAKRSFLKRIAQGLQDAAVKDVSLRKKLKLVFFESGDLEKLVKGLRDGIQYLREDAIQAYVVQHQASGATDNDASDTIQGNAQAVIDLECAHSNRSASEALYKESCSYLREISMNHNLRPGLALTVVPCDDHVSGLSYRLTLTYPHGSAPVDVLISGPLQHAEESSRNTSIRQYIDDALEQQLSPVRYVWQVPLPGSLPAVKFGLNQPYAPEHMQHQQNCNSRPWSAILSLANQNELNPPTIERYELAFSIVESAFYLLGTSWLSHLDGSELHVSSCRQKHRLALAVERFASPINMGSIEPQMFHVGVLLAEIALSTPCQITEERFGNRHEYCLTMYYNYKGSLDWWHPRPKEVLRLIREESEFGRYNSYLHAVQFCLQHNPELRNKKWLQPNWDSLSRAEREDAYNLDMLKDFYEHVYLRVKRFYELEKGLRYRR